MISSIFCLLDASHSIRYEIRTPKEPPDEQSAILCVASAHSLRRVYIGINMTEDKPGITNDSMPGKGRKHAHQSNRSSPSAYPTTFLDSTPPRAPNHRPRKPKYEPPLLSLPRSPACSFDSRTSLESHELSLPRSLSSITSRSDSIAETKLCFSPIFGLLRRKLSEPSLEYKNSAIHQSSIISREVPRSSDHENMVDSLQFHLSLDADTLQDTKMTLTWSSIQH